MKLFYEIKTWAMDRLKGADLDRVKALKLKPCSMVARDHESGSDAGRAWAHTNHVEDTICVHPGFDTGLDDEHQAGILLHEIGHILRPGDEMMADTAVKSLLGVTIEYDKHQGAVQYIGAVALKIIRKSQKKETKA